MSRSLRRSGLGVLGDGTLATLPSSLATAAAAAAAAAAGAAGTAPSGFVYVPNTQLVRGELRALLAPMAVQLPWGKVDGRTLQLQRHVNHFLGHYGQATVPEDGVMSPLLCGAFAVLDGGAPQAYEDVYGPELRKLGWLGAGGLASEFGYMQLFGSAGTNGRLREACSSMVLPDVVVAPGLVGQVPAGAASVLPGALGNLPPPPTTAAPSIADLLVQAAAEVQQSPRIDTETPPIATGWPATLTQPPGAPLPAKTPAPPARGPSPAKPAEPVAASVSYAPLVLVGLGVTALGLLLTSKGRRR